MFKTPGAYFFINLGCPKNLVDAEIVASTLDDSGWCKAPSMEQADLIVVTTCAFIAPAEEESVDTILAVAAKKRENQKLAVLGCLVSREKERLAELLPEVDVFLDVKEMIRLEEIVNPADRAFRESITYTTEGIRKRFFTPRHIAYLKISEGCSNHCSYCLIPSIRGENKSYPREYIVGEAERFSREGVKEAVVIAQDTAVWGRDLYGDYGLYELLSDIQRSASFRWLRLMYLHPGHIDVESLIGVLKRGLIVPYLDIPIQHASDSVLRSMRRGYGKKDLERLFDRLRDEVEDLVLRTTVIVGFPGETEDDFDELVQFIEDRPFDHLGVFAFSREKGTPAFDFIDQVPAEDAEMRKEEILDIQMDISSSRLSRLQGRKVEVIIDSVLSEDERPESGIWGIGRFYGQAYDIDGVTFVGGEKFEPGTMIEARVKRVEAYDVFVDAERDLG